MSATASRREAKNNPPEAPLSLPPDRATIVWRAKWWILAIALVAGALTYAISRYVVDATYSSSAMVVINAHSLSGSVGDAITASNNLAAQYAQLVDSQPVLVRAARKLGSGGDGLGQSISSGVVGGQNLVQVTARAGGRELAERRADAAATAFVLYINGVNAGQVSRLNASVPARLQASQQAISKAEAAVAEAQKEATDSASSFGSSSSVSSAVLAAKESLLASLITQRQAILADLAEGAVEAQPSVRVAALAGEGTQTEPKPFLYAVIAAVVAALVASQIFVLARYRRT